MLSQATAKWIVRKPEHLIRRAAGGLSARAEPSYRALLNGRNDLLIRGRDPRPDARHRRPSDRIAGGSSCGLFEFRHRSLPSCSICLSERGFRLSAAAHKPLPKETSAAWSALFESHGPVEFGSIVFPLDV
jgi:hypothetical protein